MITDYIPHALVGALGTVVAWVARDHFKRDDARFERITSVLDKLEAGQVKLADTMAENHATVLKLLIDEAREKDK
jgi:hypothetical protein